MTLLVNIIFIFNIITKFQFQSYVTRRISATFQFLTTPDRSLVISGRSRRLKTIFIEFLALINPYNRKKIDSNYELYDFFENTVFLCFCTFLYFFVFDDVMNSENIENLF